MELGSFSLIEGIEGEDAAPAGQVCDQCQICDSSGDCWDYDGDAGGGDQ